MSQSNNTTNKTHKVHATNKGRIKNVGTVRNHVYTKGLTYNGLIHYPELMATMAVWEYNEVQQNGALVFKIERGDTGQTHVIDMETFIRFSSVRDRGHGKEYECPLRFFQTSNAISHAEKLNTTTLPDKVEMSLPIHKPMQMELFGGGRE